MLRLSNTRVAPGISTARSRTVLVAMEFIVRSPDSCDTLRKASHKSKRRAVRAAWVNSLFSEPARRNRGELPHQEVGKLSQTTGASCEIFRELLDRSIG